MKAGAARACGFLAWLLLCGLLLAAVMVGCGKKGPPVAPKRPPLPQVTTLEGRMQDDVVHLTWQPGEPVQGIQEYVILRAQTNPASPPCPGCPQVFQRVGVVAPDPTAATLRFSETVAPGYTYRYKVQPVGSSGDTGPASNDVIIDHGK